MPAGSVPNACPQSPPGRVAQNASATAGWPGAELRAAYTGYQRELTGAVHARVRGA
ncbi:hypothetical protein ABZY20_27230 [Streptomyces sp. NPDC006624]|uniref:hypothetical protein n=1 Tax=Streptomyces sp. NPDC006624 TaxID=3154892 RepID=UPI0033BA6E0E